jgi:hypothetical protein
LPEREEFWPGNPDLAGIIAVPPRPSARDTLDMIRRPARRYDLALTASGAA